MIVIVAAICAISISISLILIVIYLQKKFSTDIFRRMRRHDVSISKNSSKSKKTFSNTFYNLIHFTSKSFGNKTISSSLDIKLKQAGISLVSLEFIIVNLIISIVVGILIYMLTVNLSIAILVSIFVPIGIWIAILILIRKRKNSFTEQLGDCLITVANALRAGYSFQQAVEVIAKEMESPISQEFAKLSADVKMGVPLEEALNEMDKRIGSTDFSLVVTAVLIQREVGGSLAQILDTISDTIMERIRMKREINALTAQGKFSAIILLILPFAIGLFMFMVNPNQINLLFEERTGQIAIVVALIMDVIGFILIQRIVDIEL